MIIYFQDITFPEFTTSLILRSESQEKTLYQNGNSAIDGGTSLGAIYPLLSDIGLEPPLESLGAASFWPPKVSQSASMQWQCDNMLLGHHISQNHYFCLN